MSSSKSSAGSMAAAVIAAAVGCVVAPKLFVQSTPATPSVSQVHFRGTASRVQPAASSSSTSALHVMGLGAVMGSAVAMQQRSMKKTTVQLKAFESELGVQAPVGFWDPAGFTADGSVENFKRRRQTELKHGRIAMPATTGYITPEALQSSGGAIEPTLYPLKHSFEAVTDEKFHQVGREGLPEVIKQAKVYMKTDDICDREALKSHVSAHFESEGGLVLMLGGKTTGKSLLLRNTVKKHNEGKGTPPENNTKGKVLYVDLRTSTQLGLVAAAVEAALKQKLVMVQKSDKDNLTGQVLGAASGMICAVMSNMPTVVVPVAGVVSDIAKRAAHDETIASLEEIVKAGVSTIVFDEANLTMDAAALKEDEIKQSKKEFEHIVSATKVTRNLSAILVSSEHAWPFKLRAAGFNTDNFNDLIVAGEVHSDAMGRLLQRWGVGDELQTLLLATYGGHIDLTFRALCELNRLGNAFRADRIIPLLGLSDCLDDKENTMKHLQAIANDGFSPVVTPNHDVGAKVISETGVGGVVSTNAKGLWSEATMHKHVLIASSHHMRYLIWRELKELQ